MNVNRKLDRLKQWAEERMGGEARTNVSDDFRALEMEMNLRFEGMERLQKAIQAYVKALSKKSEGEDKEKMLPVGYLGSSMVGHGGDFESDSDFGKCLIAFGRINERIARMQETYISDTTSTWLESVERSITQMKEYQAARKKLETRRLAYDAALAKMQKAKKEDFRVEEELRSSKIKYEEANEDVYRRMEDIRDNELNSTADLASFLEAGLAYHDRCRDALLDLKNNWPASHHPKSREPVRGVSRSRSNTVNSLHDRYQSTERECPFDQLPRSSIPAHRNNSFGNDHSPTEESYTVDSSHRPPPFEGPAKIRREYSPNKVLGTPTDPSMEKLRSQLRAATRPVDSYADHDEQSPFHDDQSPIVPQPEHGFLNNRPNSPSVSTVNRTGMSTPTGKKAPPPPPPSRAKKPPPPVPVKKSVNHKA